MNSNVGTDEKKLLSSSSLLDDAKIQDELRSSWSYEDELSLLNAIDSCGFGNWLAISRKIPPYTPSECEKHFCDLYSNEFKDRMGIDDFSSNKCEIKLKPNRDNLCSYTDVVNMNMYLKNLEKNESYCKDLNRPDSIHNSDKSYDYMFGMPSVGYNRIRSDFDIEHDNGAESILKMMGECNLDNAEMDNDDACLFEAMQVVLCESYNDRLKERLSRKKIIKDHCLLDRRKVFSMLQRLNVPFGNTTLKALLPFLRFYNGPQFDMLVELLTHQNELELQIALLLEYRKNGVKSLAEVELLKKSQNKRLRYEAELSRLKMHANGDMQSSGFQGSRKPIVPLAIGHLPGYNSLDEEEKKLCSVNRIVPETYNTFKEVLIAECKKHNGLKLAQARNLIKIDVNKTRKMYDYLMSANFIWLPEA